MRETFTSGSVGRALGNQCLYPELGQRQPKMLDALVVLGERDDIGDGLFVTVIVRDDELQFDAHKKVSPGSSDE